MLIDKGEIERVKRANGWWGHSQPRRLITLRGKQLVGRGLMQLEMSNDGWMLFSGERREYRVRGLSPLGLERLRVNVRLSVTDRATIDEQAATTHFHLDTIDLYQAPKVS